MIVRKYIFHNKRSDEKQAEFLQYIKETTVPILKIALIFLAGVILMSWPAEYFIFEKPAVFWWFVTWRVAFLATLVMCLLGLQFSSFIRNHVNLFAVVAACLVSGVAGYSVGQAATATSPIVNTPWFYVSYVIPFLTTLLSFPILQRIFSTTICTLVYVGFYLWAFPGYLQQTYPISSLILVGSSILISIVIGHIIYHLVRENYFHRQKLQELARYDQLTDLYNRRELETHIVEAFTQYQRYGGELSLIMIDLDHFKEINDTYGHQAGDEVLERVGTILNDKSRESDVPGRYGGEEFCVLLPETSLEGARELAQRIVESLRECRFDVGTESFEVTASIGLAQASSVHEDWEDFVNDADEALYAAKSKGRDRIEPASHT